jgi:hypothetical protein
MSRSKLTRLWFSPRLASPFLRKHKLDRLDFKPAERKPDRHRLIRQSLSALLEARPLQCERLQPRIVLEQVRLVRRDNLTTHIDLQTDGSVASKCLVNSQHDRADSCEGHSFRPRRGLRA